MFRPEGVFVAQATPFDADGKVDESVLRGMVDFVIDRGVDGIFPASTVGEFVLMDVDEKKRVIDIVLDQTAGRVPVTPGVGETCPDKVIPLCRYAKEAGCPAVVMTSPYYYKLDQDMIRRHFEVVAEAVDIPIILYNIPFFTNAIAPETVASLMKVPNIVGMKDSSGDAVYMMQVLGFIRESGSDFHFLTGREETLFSSLSAGVKGCMVGAAGIVPEVVTAIYDLFMDGDLERARKMQYVLLPVLRTLTAGYFPVCLKAGVEVRGFPGGPFRQPVTPEQEAKYRASFPEVEKAVEKALAEAKAILEG